MLQREKDIDNTLNIQLINLSLVFTLVINVKCVCERHSFLRVSLDLATAHGGTVWHDAILQSVGRSLLRNFPVRWLRGDTVCNNCGGESGTAVAVTMGSLLVHLANI